MKPLLRLAVPVLLVGLAVPASALPLKVRSVGTDSQIVIMCPDCSTPLVCAQVGDYTIGFSADLTTPKMGLADLSVRLTDKAGTPVTGAKVSAVLAMPKDGHATKPISFKHQGRGRYLGSTPRLGMSGWWTANVSIMTPKGDTIEQKFSFSR